MAAKIFQIGLNRCGSYSLHNLVKKSGYKSVHWGKGQLSKKMYLNEVSGLPILTGLETFDCFTDMENTQNLIFAYRLYDKLYYENNNSYFILNTRNKNNWIKSRCNHREGFLLQLAKKQFGFSRNEAIEHWGLEWDNHHKNVETFFKNKGNFLKFDIEADSINKLIMFVKDDFLLNENFWTKSHESNS